jgi:hypothetical protein
MTAERLAQLWAKLVQLKPHVLTLTATILLIIAVILALLDRIAAGSLVAALFVVVALFHFLPQLESFATRRVLARRQGPWTFVKVTSGFERERLIARPIREG